MLKDNLIEVEEHIKKACEKSGRNPEDVCLVAVSKTKPQEDIMQIYECDSLERIMFRRWWTRQIHFLRI